MDNLNISIIQSNIFWENIELNLSRFEKIIDKIEASTDLILLPEMFTTGFSMRSSELAEDMSGSTVSWMKANAQRNNAVIAGTTIIRDRNSIFNRMIVAHPDGNVHHYDKRHLFRMADENSHFKSESTILDFKLKKWLIRPLICYDLRFPVWARNTTGYDLLFYAANWPQSRRDAWLTLLKARAIENQCYVVGINRTGTDGNDAIYSGDSVVYEYPLWQPRLGFVE
jgi:omega-amidase